MRTIFPTGVVYNSSGGIFNSKMEYIMATLIVNKGSIFLKNKHCVLQESFDKLVYGINIIIKCGT